MTPQEFIRKWKPVALNERQTAQLHFKDLCLLFDHPDPIEDDPTGERFSFEKGAPKTGGGDGYADVWKNGYFAWEYKKRRRNLDEALVQLVRYAAALENPPLHVVCDTIHFKIITAWTNEVPAKYEFNIDDLAEPESLRILRAVFYDPEALRSKKTRAALTRQAADRFLTISDSLQERNPDREAVAHFVNQLVFCFFADSVKLLPDGLWKKLLTTSLKRPQRSKDYFDKLFAEMEHGGEFDLTEIMHFNGGLFDGRRALPLEHVELGLLIALSSLGWGLVDPTIFGTLFERFLDPDKRAQIGAHYTDPEKIMMIVEPVIMRPLWNEWVETKQKIEAIMSPVLRQEKAVGRDASRKLEQKFEAARAKAELARDEFIDHLLRLRILDPACGSGNFLYLALQAVKDLEYRAILDCEEYGLGHVLPRVGPEILRGIEINPFAAELARTTIWIGDIQWRIRNAIYQHPEPVLRKLDSVECRDAILARSPNSGSRSARDEAIAEAFWPEVDFIIGNPPFLGGKLLRNGLGDETVDALFRIYNGRVPAEADLVVYWFVKAWEQLKFGHVRRVGLVATNSIRGGANRRALDPIAAEGKMFEAWSDQPWVVNGAAVRVSIVCFGEGADPRKLDGRGVDVINADLSAARSDLTKARQLNENAGVSFMGDTKGGAFDIEGKIARAWLVEPLNVNGQSNSRVLKPWVNGLDLTRRPRDMWIIDFGWEMDEREAALFESPYGYAAKHIKPERNKNRRSHYRQFWWRHVEPRPGMRAALSEIKGSAMDGASRYIATPRVAKHRLFVWVHSRTLSDSAVIVIARGDDATLGILHSRFHEAWSLRLGSSLEDRPRYTPTSTFETFPFPEGLTPNTSAADYLADPRAIRIAEAAKRLDELRNNWLNPTDLVVVEHEAVPGYPDRVLPKDANAARALSDRTLTNLYNLRPQWLDDVHVDLDRAVAAAYGWPEDISLDDALAKLLALNVERTIFPTE